jgi:hypothetical protein
VLSLIKGRATQSWIVRIVTIICRTRFVVRWGEVLMASLRLQICPTTTSLTPLSHPPDLLAKTREPLLLLPRSTQKPHLKRKKNTGSCPGLPGSWVDRVLPCCCTGLFFNKPGPVQPPSWPGPGSTRRAGPGLKTMLFCDTKTLYFYTCDLSFHFYWS